MGFGADCLVQLPLLAAISALAVAIFALTLFIAWRGQGWRDQGALLHSVQLQFNIGAEDATPYQH